MRTKLKEYLSTTGEIEVNPEICQGLAWKKTQDLLKELEAIFAETCKDLPSYIKFEGISKVDPFDYAKEIMNKGMIMTEEILWSDVYLINIQFSYTYPNGNKEYMNNVVYMIYVNRGGIFTHSLNKYAIIPVLTDRVISVKPEENAIFVKLLADKINFYFKTPVPMIVNGKNRLEHIVDLSHRANPKGKINLALTNTLYLLGKYGYEGLFNKYHGVVPTILDANNANQELDKIDTNKYWVFRPIVSEYPHIIKFAFSVPKKGLSDKQFSYISKTIAGIFYTLGNIHIDYNKEALSSDRFWKIIIGTIIRGTESNAIRTYAVIEDRFMKMDTYLDDISKLHIKLRGLDNINDFYDLLFYLSVETVSLIKENKIDVWTKYPEVNYYLLYGFITKINNSKYTLIKAQADLEDMGGTHLSVKKVSNLLKITSRFVFKNILGRNRVLCIADTNYTGDNMAIGTGVLTELQENGNGVFRKSKKAGNKLSPMTSKISGYQMVVGNVLGVHKRSPTALATINPFIRVDPNTGSYVVDEETMKNVNTVDKYLHNKTGDV